MRVGAFARAAGVGVETVRYYQRRGLLETPDRPAGSARLYDEAMLLRMGFIRRAQSLGFTLDEITRLLALEAEGGSAKPILEAKLRELDSRVAGLNRMRSKVRRYADMCREVKNGERCPFLQMLSADESATES